MNDLSRTDWFCGLLVIAGLAALIAFEWLPGLALFVGGGLWFICRDAYVA